MSDTETIRKQIEHLIKFKGLSLREVSLKIGRRESYMHQYIKYGFPKRLQEIDRHRLAKLLDIDEINLRDDFLSDDNLNKINLETKEHRECFKLRKKYGRCVDATNSLEEQMMSYENLYSPYSFYNDYNEYDLYRNRMESLEYINSKRKRSAIEKPKKKVKKTNNSLKFDKDKSLNAYCAEYFDIEDEVKEFEYAKIKVSHPDMRRSWQEVGSLSLLNKYFIDLTAEWRNKRAIMVIDHAMEDEIPYQSILLYDFTDKNFTDNGYYVLQIGFYLVVRYLERISDTEVEVKALNKKYESMVQNLNDITIMGRPTQVLAAKNL